jgi:hypothetical protein
LKLISKVSLQQIFIVIKMDLAYNFINDQPLFHGIRMTINIKYLVMKFYIEKGVVTVKKNQLILKNTSPFASNKAMFIEQTMFFKERAKIWTKAMKR